jgi:hypothetical protein
VSPLNHLAPHAEERPQGRVSKRAARAWPSPFETARSAPPQGEGWSKQMTPFLRDVPFIGNRRVYLAIKLTVIALAVLLALHVFFGVV